MPLITLTGNVVTHAPYVLPAGFDLLVAVGASQTNSFNFEAVIARESWQSVTVAGIVSADNYVALRLGDSFTDVGMSLNVEQTGTILSRSGVAVSGKVQSAFINNEGAIIGTLSGPALWITPAADGFVSLTNSGAMEGVWGGVWITEVLGSGGKGRLVLHNMEGGRISATGASGANNIYAVSADNNNDSITNQGLIEGRIRLLGGDDSYDGRGGRVTGVIDGGSGNDRFILSDTAETIEGGSGIDTLDLRFTAGGYTSLTGLISTGVAAGDTYSGIENVEGSFTGADWISGNSLNNQLYGIGGNDTLYGREGNDTLFGQDGADVLNGGTGSDTLYAAEGNDTLYGSEGADRLYGGAGRDVLFGEAGADVFFFEKMQLIGGSLDTGDFIRDFEHGVDRIILSKAGFGFDPGTVTLPDSMFRSGTTNQPLDGNDIIIFRTTDQTLWIDKDGNGTFWKPVMIADLQDGAVVTASDILFDA